MPIFFRFIEGGETVEVAKTLIEKEMSEEKFIKKYMPMRTSKFLSKIPETYREKVQEIRKRLNEIGDLNLFVFGSQVFTPPELGFSSVIYTIKNKKFEEEYGEKAATHEKKDALEYAKYCFGAEFVKKNIHLLDDGKMHYFSNGEEISKEEYDKYMKEIEKLTKIVCLTKLEEKKISTRR